MEYDEKWLADYCKEKGVANPLEGSLKTTEQKRGKYGNKRTVLDGREFDSKREAERWSELRLLLEAGEIYGVFLQHPFALPGGVRYYADFVILNPDGTYTVEDAKGYRTKEYKIKKRLMRECLGIEIQEV